MSLQKTTVDNTTYLRGTLGSALVYPCALFMWVRKTNWDASDYLFSVANTFGTTLNNQIALRIAAPDEARISQYDNSGVNSSPGVNITTDAADDIWVPFMGVFTSLSNRTSRVWTPTDGDLFNTNSATALGTQLDLTEIISLVRTDGNSEGPYYIAELTIWSNFGPSAANFTTLRQGANPTSIGSANIVYYNSFRDNGAGSYPDQSGNGGPTLTLNGSNVVEGNASHPTVDALGGSATITGWSRKLYPNFAGVIQSYP